MTGEAPLKTETRDTSSSATLEAGSVLQVALQSAIECAVQAVLVILLGGLALDIAGGICKSMIPSAPPAFVGQPELEATLAGDPQFTSVLGHWLFEHRFALVFACIFIPTLCSRLGVLAASPATSRLGKLHRKVVNDWFGLIVVNAVVASASAMALSWVQDLSTARMVASILLEPAQSVLQPVISLFTVDSEGWLQQWSTWYSQNSLKLAFWFLYLTAICDDLGIPNLKSLVKSLLRLWRPT